MDLKWLLAVGVLLAACSEKHGDPPPPASSVNLPMAPPGATGAKAAGREDPSAAPVSTDVPDPDDEDMPPPVPGHPTLPGPGAGDEDAGVAL